MILQDRVALVTGSARRVGKAIALALARQGCHVAIHYGRSKNEAEEVAAEIRAMGRRAACFKADLSKPHSARALINAVVGNFGRLDVLVNNASEFFPTPLANLEAKDFQRLLTVNALMPALLAKHAAGPMRKAGIGKIINMVDISARRPSKSYLAYGASKAALWSLTEMLALELAPAIQVNGIAPGAILWASGQSNRQRGRILRQIPLGRRGDPADIAATVVYLCRDTDYVTGQVIAVDGGWSINAGHLEGKAK